MASNPSLLFETLSKDFAAADLENPQQRRRLIQSARNFMLSLERDKDVVERVCYLVCIVLSRYCGTVY